MRLSQTLLLIALAMPTAAFAEAKTALEAAGSDYCGQQGGYAEEATGAGATCLDALADASQRLHPKVEASRSACQAEDGQFSIHGSSHVIAEKDGPPVPPQVGCVVLNDGTVTLMLRMCVRCGFL